MHVESASFQPQHGGGGGMFYMRRPPAEEEQEKDEEETGTETTSALSNDGFHFQRAQRPRLAEATAREEAWIRESQEVKQSLRVLTMGVFRLEQRWATGVAR